MMQFKIEQIALVAPMGSALAKVMLDSLGAGAWSEDHVSATGNVYGCKGANEANLSFEYVIGHPMELEVLDYTDGPNWMQGRFGVSHFGMHCQEEELVEWKEFFKERNINIAQEVFTTDHTNPVIADSRRYHYCIFDTYAMLGVDLKFIVRRDL